MNRKLILAMAMCALLTITCASAIFAADQYIEKELTPIVSIETPSGGGNKDIYVINDGVITGDSAEQFDTFSGLMFPLDDDFFGYEFPKTFKVKQLEFTEGKNFVDGGWFELEDLRIEILKGGEWTKITTKCDPEYPEGYIQEDFGVDFETYTFTFDAVECDGIRLIGVPGGSRAFSSCAEIRVLAEVGDDYKVEDPKAAARQAAIDADLAEGYISRLCTAITNITPTGGGSKDINIISDGVLSVEGDENSAISFDTFIGATEPTEVYFGYTFPEKYVATQIDFYEGRQFGDGGWFGGGLRAQYLIGETWTDLDATFTPAYPAAGSADEDFLPEAQLFTITFDAIECDGVRIIGIAGGTMNFTSISELRVKATLPGGTAPATDAPAAADEAAAPATVETAVETYDALPIILIAMAITAVAIIAKKKVR
jgi:hypothetical protein